MSSRASGYIKLLVATSIGFSLAMFVKGNAVHYKNLRLYAERNYMRGRKNERKLSRYGQKLSDHELRLQKVEGFTR